MRFRTAPVLLVLTLGLAGCDDRYLVGFGPDGAAGSGGATGGPGAGGVGGSAIAGHGGQIGGAAGSAAGGAGGSEIGGSGGSGGSGYGGAGGSGVATGGMPAGMGGSAAGAAGSSGPAAACMTSPAPLPVQALGISTDHVAERLARVLWGERPDPATLARAASLRNSADVQTFARIMLQDPRAEATVKALMRRWLGLEEIGRRLDQSALSAGLRRESDAFATRMVLSEGGSLLNLLTASFTFTDSQEVATFYGVGNVITPLGFSKILPDPTQQRSGILTQGAVLRAYPRATARGVWLRAALLCQPLPPAPPGESSPPSSSPLPSTYRQRLTETVGSIASCQACHVLTDPPGFTLEHYDQAGRWRNSDDGLPIDATASIQLDAGTESLNGARSLGESLARSCSVQACAVRNFLEFGVGPLRPADELSVTELRAAFAQSGFNLKELLIAVTGSKSFLAP